MLNSSKVVERVKEREKGEGRKEKGEVRLVKRRKEKMTG